MIYMYSFSLYTCVIVSLVVATMFGMAVCCREAHGCCPGSRLSRGDGCPCCSPRAVQTQHRSSYERCQAVAYGRQESRSPACHAV